MIELAVFGGVFAVGLVLVARLVRSEHKGAMRRAEIQIDIDRELEKFIEREEGELKR